MVDEVIIDFSKIEGPVYTGRDRGERLREDLKLEDLDTSNKKISVSVPDATYSISSSFFLGLFGPSVMRCGSKDKFYERYKFKANDFLMGVIDGHVSRALQEKNLFS